MDSCTTSNSPAGNPVSDNKCHLLCAFINANYALPLGLFNVFLEQIHSEIVVQAHCVLCDAKVVHLRCL